MRREDARTLRLGWMKVAIVVAAGSAMASARCGGSTPTTPTTSATTSTTTVVTPPVTTLPSSPSTPVAFSSTGHVFDVQTGNAAVGVTVAGGVGSVASDSSGNFTVGLNTASSGPATFTFTSPQFVTRTTGVRVPGAGASISLISSTFDLTAFDQMFRTSGSSGLNRWTSAPPLVLQTQIFSPTTSATSATFITEADSLTDAEYNSLLSDLQSALPQLTGSTFQNFASITKQSAAANTSVLMLNPGVISVGYMVGLGAAAGDGDAIGFARWLVGTDGSVTGGMLMLDISFARTNVGQSQVSIVRMHELGHTLGYNHVTLEPSVMDPIVTFLPTVWDMTATKLGFQRPLLSRTPDVDPTGASTNALGRGAVWTAPIR